LTVGGLGLSTTFAGTITGDGGLTLVGGGTFTLSGTSNYAGPTTVNAGTLNLTGTLSGSGAEVVLNASNVSLTGGGTGQLTDRGVLVPAGVSGAVITGLANVTNLHGTGVGISVLGDAAVTATTVSNSATGIGVSGTATITGVTVNGGTTGIRIADLGTATLA